MKQYFCLSFLLIQILGYSQDTLTNKSESVTYILVEDESFPCFTCTESENKIIDKTSIINWYLSNEAFSIETLTKFKLENQFSINQEVVNNLPIKKYNEFKQFLEKYKACMQIQRFGIQYKNSSSNSILFDKTILNNTYLIAKSDFIFLRSLFNL